jgi:hypothetical protein
MFHGIKFPHRTSTKPAEGQPLLPKGSGQAGASSSSSAHSDLAARGSPSAAPGTMAPRGNPFLKRSDALSPQAQANAHAAFPRQRVQFAVDASIVEGNVKVGREAVEFGAKGKPVRMGAHRPPAPTPAAEQPQASPRQEPKHGGFGSLFRSHGPAAEKPAASTSTRPPEAAPAVPPHLRTERTPGEKFSDRLTRFMDHCPDKKLKDTLGGHLVQGQFGRFKEAAVAAMNTAPDQKTFELLQLMVSSINKMDGDYSDVRIRYRKS